jgi:outer membrane protein assembly factor BamB
MRDRAAGLVAIAALLLLSPASAYAKRKAPTPVPPVVWQGVKYVASLEPDQIGRVQAYDEASGRKLWETKVYHVWINPIAEEDVQWVFISSMQIQDGKLVVKNEAGKRYRLDLQTGSVEGRALIRSVCAVTIVTLLIATYLIRARTKNAS